MSTPSSTAQLAPGFGPAAGGPQRIEVESPDTRKTALWLESAIIVLVAWALTRVLGLGLNFIGLDLIQLAVAIVAARSGFWPGLFAGLLGSVALLMDAHLPPEHFVLLATGQRLSAIGCLGPLALGIVLGWVGDAHRHKQRKLHQETSRVLDDLSELRTHHEVVARAKEVLDRRIVGQVQTITAVADAAKALESLAPEAILPATVKLAARYLEAEAVSAYSVDGFRLRLTASEGDLPGRPSVVKVDEGVLGAVARTGEPLGVRSAVELANSPVLMAAPVKDANGMVRAVLAVERLPFSHLVPSSMQLLELLAEWASRSWSNSETLKKAQELQAVHPITGAMRVGLVLERYRQEFSVARRYKLPLSLVLVRQPRLLDLPSDQRAEAAVPLVVALRRLTRDVDLLGHYRTDDAFLLVLPATPRQGVEILESRIRAAVPDVVSVIACNDEQPNNPEDLLQLLQVLAFELDD